MHALKTHKTNNNTKMHEHETNIANKHKNNVNIYLKKYHTYERLDYSR